jgi:glycosyltransferase involved in cell wall biosynthesis
MNLGITSYAHSGYTKFLPKLCKSISEMTIKPSQVTFVVDKPTNCKDILKGINYKEILTERITMGAARNLAIENTPTEWIMYISADDTILPNAIEELQKYKDADVISISFNIRQFKGKENFYNPGRILKRNIFSEDFYCSSFQENPFYIAFSPFKRKVWEQVKYADSDFPNALFWIDIAFKDFKFAHTRNPCATYKMRKKSHSNSVTQERRGELINYIQSYRKDEREKWLKEFPKLSVFSIVRDEEDLCRESWESTKGCDELVICIDDRTTDKTPEIAKEFTDKIYYFKWEDDFSKAKNFAMSKCTGDWVVGIDADCIFKNDSIKKIKHAIKETEKDMIDITLYPIGQEWKKHVLPKVFKNDIIRYEGIAHEHPVGGKRDMADYGIEIEYDYSPNHKKDPDRYVRLLTRAVEKEPENTRWKFYLAREFFYRKDYKKAIELYNEYIEKTTFLAEKAEAYLTTARCYWATSQGDKARNYTLKAIEINPNFKEAFLFMSEIVWPRHSNRWIEMAEGADNSEVLFIK